jgi:hypothetical protein
VAPNFVTIGVEDDRRRDDVHGAEGTSRFECRLIRERDRKRELERVSVRFYERRVLGWLENDEARVDARSSVSSHHTELAGDDL